MAYGLFSLGSISAHVIFGGNQTSSSQNQLVDFHIVAMCIINWSVYLIIIAEDYNNNVGRQTADF